LNDDNTYVSTDYDAFKEKFFMTAVQETVLSVPDVSCEHCVNAINGALIGLPGVETVNTDIPTKTVLLRFDPNKVTMGKIEAMLDDIGYTVMK
jgi:copper chaperone